MINPDLLTPSTLEELETIIASMPTERAREAARVMFAEFLTYGQISSKLYLQPPMPLRKYMREAWHVVEPNTTFHDNWHIGAVAEHLEATQLGQILRLIINIPPGTMKSLMVSVFFMTWVWTFKPWYRWIFAAYAQTLTTRDSVKCREIIQSEWYQKNWGHLYQLTGDQNEKTLFKNDRTGYRIATSVGGQSTGEKGDCVVIDDPSKVDDDGVAAIKRVNDWNDLAMPLRLNNQQTGVRILVMQRFKEDDLSGHILAKDLGYTHLMLPMRYEKERACVTVLGHPDPRTEEGELLWPELYPEVVVKPLERELGSYGVAGQFQQRPAPAGGGMFKREWFKIVTVVPRRVSKRVRFWDIAGTKDGGDWTVGTKMSFADGIYYIEHVIRDQITEFAVNTIMLSTAKSDGQKVRIREEEEGGSSGKAVTAARLREMAGFDYSGDKPGANKQTRARPFSAQCEAGNVVLVDSGWDIEKWLDEICVFPNGKHDDQVDSSTGAFNELALGKWGGKGGIF